MDKQRRTKRLALLRTLDHKRTISSEQSHYSKNGRKYTLQNNQIKFKPYSQKLSSISRKNQSLPRALSSINENKNIRTRKLNFNALDFVKKEPERKRKSSKVQFELKEEEKEIFQQGIKTYKQKCFSKARSYFEELEKKVGEKHPQTQVFLGLCFFHEQKFDKTILHLSKVINENEFEEQVYSSLTSAYEITKNYICALNTINLWIQRYSENPQAYLIRARINLLFKEYEKALKDYQMCYHYNPRKLEAYIEEAQILYKISGIEESLERYNNLLVNYKKIWPQSQYSDINYVKYRKSILLIQQKQYESALKLLINVNNPELSSQIFYYIGIIHSILGNFEEATLSYQKSIQANTSEKFLRQSYYEKFVILFKKNDYYGIQHELDLIKGKYHFKENQALQFMRKIVEGVIAILKMNFQEGIQLLNDCKQDPIFKKNEKIYKVTLYSFIAFGYYSIRNFKACLKCIEVLGRRITEANHYNLLMAKGILLTEEEHYNDAMNHFYQAQKIEPFHSHTSMVKAIVQILFYNTLQKKNKKTNNNEILLSAEELLSKCLLKERQNDQILYLIAVICYELDQHEEGLKFIRKAIQTSDDHTIKHYYLKANLKLMLDLTEEAINDYTNALIVMKQQESLEEKPQQQPITQCYLERAKCYLLHNNKEKAEADLRLYFSELENVKKDKQNLDLFMHVGASDVILQIYQKILNEEYDIKEKMKCYYLSKQLNSCLEVMDTIISAEVDITYGQNQQNIKLSIDRECLNALKVSSQGSELFLADAMRTFEEILEGRNYGDIFTESDCMFFAGVMSFYLKEYSKAKNYFIDSKAEKLRKSQIQGQEEEYDNKTYSIEQINYNIGICDFIQGRWSPYLDDYPEFVKSQKNVTEDLLEELDEITPFPIKNRLCSIYTAQTVGNYVFRLSFCLPQIKLKPVKMLKNKNIIKSITFRDIEMRPSAPWIMKNKNGIMFTDELMKDSIDLKSEKSEKVRRGRKGEERYKHEESQEIERTNKRK